MSSLAIDYFPISTSTQQAQGGGNSAEARKLFLEMNALFISSIPA